MSEKFKEAIENAQVIGLALLLITLPFLILGLAIAAVIAIPALILSLIF